MKVILDLAQDFSLYKLDKPFFSKAGTILVGTLRKNVQHVFKA